jgi:DNA-binding XRE family transcriptional regulator
MYYSGIVTKQGKRPVFEFPDCPGCQTVAAPGESLKSLEGRASESLASWLERKLLTGEAPPRPGSRKGKQLFVEVPPKLALKLSLRWARQDRGLTQTQLAKKLGVSQQQVAMLEKPKSNPTIETLEKAARALEVRLIVQLEPGTRPQSGRLS